MLTSSLQSTWDSHKSRQRTRYSNGGNYHGSYADQENEHKSSGYADRSGGGQKSSFGNRNHLNSYHQGTSDAAGHYSELPNLRVPQSNNSYGRANLGATTGSIGGGGSGGGGGISPRRDGSAAKEQHVSINKKYRASSRQSGQKGSRRGGGNKYVDNFGGSGVGGGDHGGLGPGAHSGLGHGGSTLKTAGGLATGQQHQQAGADGAHSHLLPHISSSSQQQQARSMYRSPMSSKPPSPSMGLLAGQPGPSAAGSPGGGGPVAREFTNGSMLINTEEHLCAAVTSIRGLKPGNPNWINQDNFFVAENFGGRDVRLYCVLDGHGEHGHLVSRRCREQFPHYIKASGMDIPGAFSSMQGELNSSNDFDARCSGATCVMVCLVGNRVAVYNCGDSRAVLGRRNPNGSVYAVALSKDHKPDKPEERKRILSVGGHLGCRQVLVNQPGRGPVSMPVGPCRVWYQHRGETLGLAMSRSLGDTIVHKSGVSAEPELQERALDDYDDFLILATDGVWDVVDNNHAVQMVHNCASKSVNWNPLEAANSVCRFARSRWEKLSPMIDDITCIVVKIHR